MKGITREDNGLEIRYIFGNKDKLYYHKRGIWIDFVGPRRVLSTSILNGGIREDLKGVFNYNCMGDQYQCELTKDSYEMELAYNAKQIGLMSEPVTGLSTAAWMEYLSVHTESYQELFVTAIVTGGIDKNAVRVGDPASYYEKNGVFHMIQEKQKITPGTINIIVVINQNLTAGILARALVTCTEAKVAAIEELMIGSLYSKDFATGSGTDGTILIADPTSSYTLTDAGEHSKLGELIGVAVKKAVKEALYLQAGVCPPRQHKISERGKRYGISLGSLWECFVKNKNRLDGGRQSLSIQEFETCFQMYETNSTAIVWLSLYLHMLDQYRWGMLKWGEVIRETRELTKGLLHLNEEKYEWIYEWDEKEELVEQCLERLKRGLVCYILNR